MKLFEIKINLITITLTIEWHDIWIGMRYDESVNIYLCLLPCLVISIDLLQWVRSKHNEGKFVIQEYIFSLRNIFFIFIPIYYAILFWIAKSLWGR